MKNYEFAFGFSIIAMAWAQAVNIGCGIATRSGIYDLRDLSSPSSGYWNALIPMKGSTSRNLHFSVCSLMTGCAAETKKVWGLLQSPNGTCLQDITNSSTPSYSLYTDTTSSQKLVLVNYTNSGLKCTEDEYYSFELYVKCNKEIDVSAASPKVLSYSTCSFKVLLEVEQGCSVVNFSLVQEFMDKHLPLFVAGFILLGVVMGVFGLRLWKVIVFILVALSCTAAVVIIMYELVLPIDSPIY